MTLCSPLLIHEDVTVEPCCGTVHFQLDFFMVYVVVNTDAILAPFTNVFLAPELSFYLLIVISFFLSPPTLLFISLPITQYFSVSL